jgi:hypothetical protein
MATHRLLVHTYRDHGIYWVNMQFLNDLGQNLESVEIYETWQLRCGMEKARQTAVVKAVFCKVFAREMLLLYACCMLAPWQLLAMSAYVGRF